jgi:hypothetical protein
MPFVIRRMVYLYILAQMVIYTMHKDSNVNKMLIRELMFEDDAAFVSHSVQELQSLLTAFSYACSEFG